MSLLSRLDRLRDKDTEIRKAGILGSEPELLAPELDAPASGSTSPIGVSTQPEMSTRPAVPPVASSATDAPSTRPMPASLGNGLPGDDSIISISKPSMIKVSGGAVTSPLGAAAAVAKGVAIPAAGSVPAPPMTGSALDSETDPQAAQLALVQEIEGEDKNDVRRLYRFKHALFDSVMGALDARMWTNPQRDPVRSRAGKSAGSVDSWR
jgi:hypothetical protein